MVRSVEKVSSTRQGNDMARKFGPQHMKSGYAAMGGNKRRPIYGGINSGLSVAASIAKERAKAVRMANAKKSK